MRKATWLVFFAASIGFAADEDPAWKSKQIADWSENDAKDLLADSPWVKNCSSVTSLASV